MYHLTDIDQAEGDNSINDGRNVYIGGIYLLEVYLFIYRFV